MGTSLIWVIIIYHTRRKADAYGAPPSDDAAGLGGTGPDGTPYHAGSERSPLANSFASAST